MCYAGVVSHVLMRCATDPVIVEADALGRCFQQSSLTLKDFPQKLWDLTVAYENVYNKQAISGPADADIGHSIGRSMRL